MKQFVIFAGAIVLGLLLLKGLPPSDPGPPDDAWFRDHVVEQSGLVLVKFGADWCGPCRAMEGELDELELTRSGRVRVVCIDVDEKQKLASHYGVGSIPRSLLMRDGKLLDDRKGHQTSAALTQWVDSFE